MKPSCRITTATLFTVCSAVSIAVCAGSAVSQERDPAVAIRKIRAAITATLKRDTPAVMLSVVKDGKVFLTHTEGKVGKNRKADAATLFPMGGSSRVLANLVLAQLHTAEQVDAAKANVLLKTLQVLAVAGAPSPSSLHDVLVGEDGFPGYANFLRQKDLARWPLSRAIDENAFLRTSRSYKGSLAYAILQQELESTTRQSWNALVHTAVAKRLGLRNLVPDARTGLPTNRAELYRTGLFGLPVVERRWYSNIAAAHGAWIDSADLAKLLVELLRVAGERSSVADLDALCEERIEFANYRSRSWHGTAYLVEPRGTMPGMHGGIMLWPEHEVAWAVYANSSIPRPHGLPEEILVALRNTMLPKPGGANDEQWNTAVGIMGGAVSRGYKPDMHGEWAGDIKLHGRPQTLRMWIEERGVRVMQFANRRRVAVRSLNYANKLQINGGDVMGLRADTTQKTEAHFEQVELNGEPTFQGTIRSAGEYCEMEFYVELRRVKARPGGRKKKAP